MSIKCMARIWAQSSRKDGELLVMLALGDFANDDGESWPSLKTLAQKARITVGQLSRVLKSLEVTGEIRRLRTKGGWNQRTRYSITIPDNSCVNTTLARTQRLKNNSVLHARATVAPVQHALNHHRTINKTNEPYGSSSFPHGKKGKSPSLDPIQAQAFGEFYEAYPRHVGRAEAEKAWMKLSPNPELRVKIMVATRRYAEEKRETEPEFIKHPGPWLNTRRWEDEPTPAGSKQQQSQMRNIG